jgi:hypothetical protein
MRRGTRVEEALRRTSRTRGHWVTGSGAALVAAVTLSGCQSLLFRQDHRITIVSPDSHSTIASPLTLAWTTHDFTAPRDGSFVVFVDRAPMSVGDTVADVDPKHTGAGIYMTAAAALRIDSVAPNGDAASADKDLHDFTVVLVDPRGHRIGESAGFVEVTVQR